MVKLLSHSSLHLPWLSLLCTSMVMLAQRILKSTSGLTITHSLLLPLGLRKMTTESTEEMPPLYFALKVNLLIGLVVSSLNLVALLFMLNSTYMNHILLSHITCQTMQTLAFSRILWSSLKRLFAPIINILLSTSIHIRFLCSTLRLLMYLFAFTLLQEQTSTSITSLQLMRLLWFSQQILQLLVLQRCITVH